MSGAAEENGSEARAEQRRGQIEFARRQLAELDSMDAAIGIAREQLLDHFDHLLAGKCAECQIELFIGDQGHSCLDGDPIFCAEHAYSWADVKDSYEFEGGLKTEDPPAYAAFLQRLQAHIAGGGSAEDKIIHVL